MGRKLGEKIKREWADLDIDVVIPIPEILQSFPITEIFQDISIPSIYPNDII